MGASRSMVGAVPGKGGLRTATTDRARRSAQLQVRGLVFDLEDVLYDATLGRRWMLQQLSRMGVKRDYHDFYRAWDREFLIDVQRGRREYAEAFQAFLLSQGLSWAQTDELQGASRAHCQELESGVRPLPGVIATLGELSSRGIALAVLADCVHPARELEEHLESLGIGGRFQAVLSSFDLEATKPSLLCYQAALRALNLTTGEVLYIGHESQDLNGAANAGMRTVAINHAEDAQADHYLTRFEELLEIVAGDRDVTP